MKKALSILACTALLALSGCYYDNEQELYPNSYCDTTSVTWSFSIQPLINSNCAIPGCHVPGAQSPDLSTYEVVRSNAASIRGVVIDGSPFIMPPTGQLPSCDRLKVSRWVDGGALQN